MVFNVCNGFFQQMLKCGVSGVSPRPFLSVLFPAKKETKEGGGRAADWVTVSSQTRLELRVWKETWKHELHCWPELTTPCLQFQGKRITWEINYRETVCAVCVCFRAWGFFWSTFFHSPVPVIPVLLSDRVKVHRNSLCSLFDNPLLFFVSSQTAITTKTIIIKFYKKR